MTEYRAHVVYTSDLVRAGVRAFMWRKGVLRAWWLWLSAILLMLFGLIGVSLGGLSATAGTYIGAAVLWFAYFSFIWWRAKQDRLSLLPKGAELQAELVFTDESVTIATVRGTSILPWSRFVEAWQLPGAWLLFVADRQYVTLPVKGVSEAALAFARSKLPVGKARRV